MTYIDIVFDGPPSHESGRLVEVENAEGRSINAGEWLQRPDGYWVLRIKQAAAVAARDGAVANASERVATPILVAGADGKRIPFDETDLNQLRQVREELRNRWRMSAWRLLCATIDDIESRIEKLDCPGVKGMSFTHLFLSHGGEPAYCARCGLLEADYKQEARNP